MIQILRLLINWKRNAQSLLFNSCSMSFVIYVFQLVMCRSIGKYRFIFEDSVSTYIYMLYVEGIGILVPIVNILCRYHDKNDQKLTIYTDISIEIL